MALGAIPATTALGPFRSHSPVHGCSSSAYMVATGLLTIHLALSDVRDGSTTAWVVAVFAGVASVGLMAVVNLILRSDFRRPLLGLASLWAAGTILAALGI